MNTITAEHIQERMEVVCSKGMHVGTVDHVNGDEIKLTRNDSKDGMHHCISRSLVASIDDKVHLSKPCDEVEKNWTTE